MADNSVSPICWDLVPYMRGRALDVNCGKTPIFPHFRPANELTDSGLFASQSCDCVFSLALEPKDIKEWWRVLRTGGYFCLYLPVAKVKPEDMKAAVWELGGCDLIECRMIEDSFFHVYRKEPKVLRESWKEPKPAKTCGIVRYGAQGDMIQASSIFPWLKEQGYHITLYCQPGAGYDVVKNDPHIDRFILQEKDSVPGYLLPEFWEATRKKYDKWINLSESVEGTLLAIAGRPNHEWPNAVRARMMDRNYLEWTHELAEVPPPYMPKFYSTLDERAWARKKAGQFGKRNILWSLAGSSGHKVWPYLDAVVGKIMLELRNTHVVLVGDDVCKILEVGWEKEPRVHCQSGEWTIRQSMAFAEVADLIIGSETGLLNAAGSMDAPKIVTLSHSSEEMLTKHWKNAIPLRQPSGVGCDRQPCRQLHQTWEYCNKHEPTGTALCQASISASMMWDAIASVMEKA